MSTPDAMPSADDLSPLGAYTHDAAKRKNIPPAGLAGQGKIREVPKLQYAYDPHLPPVLRSDPTGQSDAIPELLAKARQSPLSEDDVKLLADALRNHEPWLEWAGKREAKSLDVDPIGLHIHERVSAQAILRVAARQDVTRNLFADPQQEYREAVQFYLHDVDWSNRLILGDSLQVMASLARREELAGKVQCIYIDPPYGIKYGSNFQSEVGKRDVKDRPEDLTREPEMVKAYRDTWNLGVHSYLAYLRDRLLTAKELLTDSGSVFVQISDENLHRVRMVMDEVFGPENFVGVISFKKTGGSTAELLSSVTDYLLWFARDRTIIKYKQVYLEKTAVNVVSYRNVELSNGFARNTTEAELIDANNLPKEASLFQSAPIVSAGFRQFTTVPFTFAGVTYHPGASANWKTTLDGMARLASAERIIPKGKTLNYKRYLNDFPVMYLDNYWNDVGIGYAADQRYYVVQTQGTVIERCLLMTTDPGDLVLDPTCGSGTTAYVAEQWGRRWITIDNPSCVCV